jgi:hypothetical protein
LPEAEHEVVLVDDQFIVIVSPTLPFNELPPRLIVGLGMLGLEEPPPPPPPHEVITKIIVNSDKNLFIKLLYDKKFKLYLCYVLIADLL